MVEAAVVMPLFLAFLLVSMYVMVLCFKILRFQYEIADLTRQTFLLTPLQRAQVASGGGAGIGWEDFLRDQLAERLQIIGLASPLEPSIDNVQFSSAMGVCEGWNCASTAKTGDIFSISFTLNEPVFGATLASVSWQRLSVETKAIAFVLKPQNEEG
jgi:hypothetical protein